MMQGVTAASDFDHWCNSTENYNKCINGEEVEDFSLFDINNVESYTQSLYNFSSEYISLYDEDGDGCWNKEEFTNMATAGAYDYETLEADAEEYKSNVDYYQDNVIAAYDEDGDGLLSQEEFYNAVNADTLSEDELSNLESAFEGSDFDGDGNFNAEEALLYNTIYSGDSNASDILSLKTSSELKDLYDTTFEDLNVNDSNDVIDAGEYASFLLTTDIDTDIYNETDGDVASAIDGVLQYEQFNAISSIDPSSETGQIYHNIRESFYETFYAS